MKYLLAGLACCGMLAATAAAQDLSSYLGPGVLTNGAGAIGNPGGEQVDLRYYIDVNAIYDNGIQPVSVNSDGKLTQVPALEGMEAQIGAYGTHSWRTALLGLDFRGDFREYANGSYFDGSDDILTLGYTYQKSRRLYFDFQGTGGTYSNYLGGVPNIYYQFPNAINQPTLLLFDNRTDFVQGDGGMTYLLSARASITVGGDAFDVKRQSAELIGMEGYNGRARFQYRLSRVTSIGAQYNRAYFQYPNYFGNSSMNNYSAFFATQISRLWTLSIMGGAFQINTMGLTSVALSPAVAAILGVSSVIQTFTAKDWLPSGDAKLIHKFKNAELDFDYARSVFPGNGVYLTSRVASGTGNLIYTGSRKVTFSIGGGYWSMSSLGQGLQPYQTFTGSTSFTYTLTRALHAVARYDFRQQEITIVGFRASSYRVTLGLAFSPGALPLSLW